MTSGIDEGRALVALMRAAEERRSTNITIWVPDAHSPAWGIDVWRHRGATTYKTAPTLLDAVLAALADLGVAL